MQNNVRAFRRFQYPRRIQISADCENSQSQNNENNCLLRLGTCFGLFSRSDNWLELLNQFLTGGNRKESWELKKTGCPLWRWFSCCLQCHGILDLKRDTSPSGLIETQNWMFFNCFQERICMDGEDSFQILHDFTWARWAVCCRGTVAGRNRRQSVRHANPRIFTFPVFSYTWVVCCKQNIELAAQRKMLQHSFDTWNWCIGFGFLLIYIFFLSIYIHIGRTDRKLKQKWHHMHTNVAWESTQQ